MQQLVFIRGGEAFDTMEDYYAFLEEFPYDPFAQGGSWRTWLAESVVTTHQVICPDMPCKQNATYRARKIRFEKLLPYLNDEGTVLVGYSLGGWFLAKYLSQEVFPKRIAQLHLVATPLDAEGVEGEGAADFGFDVASLPRIGEQVEQIFVYHSTDDDIVPYRHVETFQRYLPMATVTTFVDRGHFFVSEFPEILANINTHARNGVLGPAPSQVVSP